MFLGQFEHTLDAKNRITLPARYRDGFGQGIVVGPGMDGCLALYSRQGWDQFVNARLSRLDPLSREGRLMTRHLFGRAVEVEPDKQGRVQLPSHLVRHAGLERDVVIAGARNHFEIWDAQRWQRFVEEAEKSAEAIADNLARGERDAASR